MVPFTATTTAVESMNSTASTTATALQDTAAGGTGGAMNGRVVSAFLGITLVGAIASFVVL